MKIWDRDNWNLLAILFYCFVLAYFAPTGIARLGFLPLLYFAYRSNNNAFWLILLLVFIDNPAYFFQGTGRLTMGRTPLYPFIGGGIGFNELLSLTLFFKSLNTFGYNLLYEHRLKILVIAVVTSFAISFAYLVSLDSFVMLFRRLTMWLFLFSIPRLLTSRNDWFVFFKLLFPFAFLIFFDQLQMFISGKPIAGFFNPNVGTYRAMREVVVGSEDVSRALSAPAMIFIGFTGALLMTLNNEFKHYFRKFYPLMVVITLYLVILLSATRGWFLSFTAVILIIAIVSGGRQFMQKIAPYFIIGTLLAASVIGTSGVLQTQFANAWNRISTVGLLAQGDLSAGGTLGRLTIYAPKLLDHIGDAPFGYGFSNNAFSFENDHLGLINPIITFGIQGYFLILLFIFLTMKKLKWLQTQLSYRNPHKNALLFVISFFIGLFIIHFTTRQIFGLNLNANINLMVTVIFGMANWVYMEAIHFHNNFQISNENQK